MILTVTLNPSLDRTLALDELRRGEVLRVARPLIDPGGKGINVARALTANGVPTQAILPVGGSEGRQLVDLLAAAGVATLTVPIADAVRSNVTIVEHDGSVTKLNEPGPTLLPDEVASLLGRIEQAAAGVDWVVVSGSLPPGSDASLLAEVVTRGHAAGARVAVDTSGAPLLAALAARPDLVKPNREELVEATGMTLTSIGDVIDAAHRLRELGAVSVLSSLGPDGAVLVNGDVELHAERPVARTDSSVGAGDATLAGYLAAGHDPKQALATAVAYGAAAVQLPGSQMPGPNDLDPGEVQVHGTPDRLRPLTPEVGADVAPAG